MDRRTFVGTGALAALSAALPGLTRATTTQTIEIDLKQNVGALDHIWSKSVGSDRAAITLRETWRKDVSRLQQEAGIERVRFHGIFNDELGVYAPSLLSRSGEPNFRRVINSPRFGRARKYRPRKRERSTRPEISSSTCHQRASR